MEPKIILNEFGFIDVFATLRTDPEWERAIKEAYPDIKDDFNVQEHLDSLPKCVDCVKPPSNGTGRTPFELLEEYNRNTQAIENMMFTCQKCGINIALMGLMDMIEHKRTCKGKTQTNEH